MNKETKIGMITLFLCLLIGAIAFIYHPASLFGRNAITVHAIFDSAQGVKAGNHVMYAGVSIGKVEKISIQDGKALLTLSLKNDTPIPKDVEFTIDNKGLIGDTYVKITGGHLASGTLADNDTVEEYHSDKMDRLMKKAQKLMDSAEEVEENVSKMQ